MTVEVERSTGSLRQEAESNVEKLVNQIFGSESCLLLPCYSMGGMDGPVCEGDWIIAIKEKNNLLDRWLYLSPKYDKKRICDISQPVSQDGEYNPIEISVRNEGKDYLEKIKELTEKYQTLSSKEAKVIIDY